MSDSTSKEERVAAALSRVRGLEASGTNPKCLAAEDKLKKQGDKRTPIGADVSYSSANRRPNPGVVSVPGELVEDLSMHEIRHWFLWTGINGFSVGSSWDQNIHPDAIEELELTSANWARRYTDIRDWYFTRYHELHHYIEYEWFGADEEEEEECYHHWHFAYDATMHISIDNDGDLEEWDVSEDTPDLECCECETRRDWEDVVSKGNNIYDLINP